MTFELWDVVVVPFPFTERVGQKRRPALVVSKKEFNQNGHTLLAMITTQIHPPWPGDTLVEDSQAAGLPDACLVRLKVFTLDNRIILKKAGHLFPSDQTRVVKRFRPCLF